VKWYQVVRITKEVWTVRDPARMLHPCTYIAYVILQYQILRSAVTSHIRVHALSRECCTRLCERQRLDVQFHKCDTVGNKEKDIYYDGALNLYVQFKTSAIFSESGVHNQGLRMRQFYPHSMNIETS
jgi:hypothetical protein